MEIVTGISKAFSKTLFFRKKKHWMITWARLLPALLVSKQWTLVAWLIHMDHICHLHEYYKSFSKGSEFLVTMYEDRLRHHWHKHCESGRRINMEVEA